MTAEWTARTVREVVAEDLCIGCGLCEAVAHGRLRMTMTGAGSLRPDRVDALTDDEERTILMACPGVIAEAPTPDAVTVVDAIWGPWRTMRYAWAADPDIRHRGSTGGVLTALATHLVDSGQVSFVLHVGADPERPMRSTWAISDSHDEVIARAGSRYGPTSPLAGFEAALGREEPFAIVAKPCDLGAVRRLAAVDDRIDRWCVARLALVCGGQSRLSKSERVLAEAGIDESEVTLFRYRGHGNPGPTRVETGTNRIFETSYLSMWGDETSWELETRCKVCPDALGECADVVAADVWPGGAPVGEDEGRNGIIVRTERGERIVDAARRAGALAVGEVITPREFDDFQPHQVRKKVALAARFAGRASAGSAVIETVGLRVDELGSRLSEREWQHERSGARRRAVAIRTGANPSAPSTSSSQ